MGSAPRGAGTWLEQSEALHARVQALVRHSLAAADGALGDAGQGLGGEQLDRALAVDIDSLALDIARYQAAHVPAVAQLYAAHGLEPAALRHASEIPALPCEIFRLRRVAAHAPALDERCFRTSGTTQGALERGEHAMRTTATYAAAALGWGKRMLWPDRDRLRFVGLVAPEDRAADSSLSFMLARFAEQLDRQPSWHFDGERLDVDGLPRACQLAHAAGEALLVAGTAFALVELGGRLGGHNLPLPAGSRVMQTGGFKGRTREIEPALLRRLAAALFAVPESHVVGEYGMTELSSQLYEGTLRRALGLGYATAEAGCYFAPPWVRVTAVDPIDLVPLPAGQSGLARMLDLANVDSAVAILTSDLVRERADGSIEHLGRAPGAEPRGCSLGIEEALES
jgi:hypothetical protein